MRAPNSYPKFSKAEMLAVECQSCGTTSTLVGVPLMAFKWTKAGVNAATMRKSEEIEARVQRAFQEIGWDVGRDHAWCTECKKYPR
jgi:hypothetical protein